MDKAKHKSSLVPFSAQTDWPAVTALSDFTYPWENSKAPGMVFKAFHDFTLLHCHFEVMDSEAKAFVINHSKEDVLQGDRVEIFFRKDEEMDPYYCLEIDYMGRVYDYRASWHRKFEPQWSWPSGQLKVEAHKTNDGYTVSVQISLVSLEQLGLLRSSELQVGLFRGQCVASPGEMKWISWVRPSSELPDFHIPSAFGILRLGTK